eukprot:3888041-Prymnesium_polylepis.1
MVTPVANVGDGLEPSGWLQGESLSTVLWGLAASGPAAQGLDRPEGAMRACWAIRVVNDKRPTNSTTHQAKL